MNKIEKLLGTPLFAGIDREELDRMMGCLCASQKAYPSGGSVMLAGDDADRVGLVIEGSVQVSREDINGNRNILARFGEGELFGEVFACMGVERIPVTVIASPGTTVLFIDLKRIVGSCGIACAFHSRLIANLLRLLAQKNLLLNEKVTCVGHRSTREKIEAFLMMQWEKEGQNPFKIPFTRAEMADYLCVDRSAMSAVLGKMRDEGVLRFNRSSFELLSLPNTKK